MIHAIIFDMDGVLIDSQPMHYLGDQQTLAAHSVEVPVEEMTAYAGTTNQLRFELFKERYHLDADVADMIREREATMIRLVSSQFKRTAVLLNVGNIIDMQKVLLRCWRVSKLMG